MDKWKLMQLTRAETEAYHAQRLLDSAAEFIKMSIGHEIGEKLAALSKDVEKFLGELAPILDEYLREED